jgi:prostatic aicd phosphatase
MSIQLVLASLFAPKNTDLEWNKGLNWQPVPLNYEPLKDDMLLLVRKKCPRYNEELERVLAEDVAAEIDSNLLEELSNITGLEIKTPDDVQSLYSTLKAEVIFLIKNI